MPSFRLLKSVFLFSLCSGFYPNLEILAQQEKPDFFTISKIKDIAFNHSHVMDNLFNLTDVCGPRLTGSSNLKNAQEWACKQMKDWGLVNVNREAWGGFGKGWEIQKSYIAMTQPYYQELVAVPKAWTPGTNGLVSASVVLVRIESESDMDKYKGQLKGKIIVLPGTTTEMKLGLKPDATRYTEEELQNLYKDKSLDEKSDERSPADIEKLKAARKLRMKVNIFLSDENALAVISGRGNTMGTLFTTNGASYAVAAKPVLPEMEMSPEHFNRIIRLLDAKKDVHLDMEIATKFSEQDTLQYNVVAEIPGTDNVLKNELVIIGAHMDSWHSATGATDNAAGCAVMMEAMRILDTLMLKPRRTIRIVLWSGEEQGLLGSKGYVKNHFADPVTMQLKPEHAKVSAYYNLDNGGGKIRGIYLQGNDAMRPLFESWLNPFHDLGATTVTTRSTGSTDHIAFDEVGIPGFQFIQDPMDYFSRTHHSDLDTYDRLQKADLMQASAIIASFVYATAMSEQKIIRKPLPQAKPKPIEKTGNGTVPAR